MYFLQEKEGELIARERRKEEEVGEIAAQSMITGEKGGEGEKEDVEDGADRGCGGQLLPISVCTTLHQMLCTVCSQASRVHFCIC